jgi:hypothetical protein
VKPFFRILLKLSIYLLFLFGYISYRPMVWLFINIIFLQTDNRISELVIFSTRIIIWGSKFSIATWSTTVVILITSSSIYPVGLVLFWFLISRVVIGLELLLYLVETCFNTNCRSQVNIYSLIYNYRLEKYKFIFRYSLVYTKNLVPHIIV